MKYQLKINAKDYTVDVGEIKSGSVQVVVNGRAYEVQLDMPPLSQTPSIPAATTRLPSAAADPLPSVPAAEAGAVVAPIPGLLLEIKVSQGERVSAGQIVATMEAMKMENNLTAPISGAVLEIRVHKGAEVSTGEIIMRIG